MLGISAGGSALRLTYVLLNVTLRPKLKVKAVCQLCRTNTNNLEQKKKKRAVNDTFCETFHIGSEFQ